MRNRLCVIASQQRGGHPSPTLVQLVLWGVIGTFVLVGGTVGYTVAEIATRKWPNGEPR